jgi:ferric-chelate reductase [NAD(P)H]
MDQRALWSISYGLYVVSSCDDGSANGQIANTVFQVAAEPPRMGVAINKLNYTHELISKSGVICASVLAADAPMKFIGLFGFRSGRDVDKFAEVETMIGNTGCPCVTEHAVSIFEAKVFGSIDVGTHTLFVADVISGKVLKDMDPMTYATYHQMKGKAPKTAPTYQGPTPEKAPTDRGAPEKEGS